MAVTHEVRWSVSATPVAKEGGADGGALAYETLHENIRKSVGGSGVATITGTVDKGGTYADGVNTDTPYLSATSGGVAIGQGTSTFIWIRHTGYEYSTATVLGDATTDTINVLIGAEVVAALRPGEAWIIPLHGAVSDAAWTAKRGGSDDIAVEVLGLI